MTAFSILDCTLRDGGYYTDWDFPDALVESYLEAMRSLPVAYVEAGYRAPPKTGYLGRYFYLDINTLSRMKAALRPDQGLAVMLNYKEVSLKTIDALTADLPGVVDLVRFACPPEAIAQCIDLARPIKRKGLRVAINVMYLTKYVDDPSVLLPLAAAGDVVDYVALVDSYGGIMPEQVEAVMAQATQMLPQPVGFHGHDNLTLAFANSLAALRGGATMLDATITGMGRGAGNLKTELIFVHREAAHPTGTHFGQLSNAVEAFEALQREYQWGTNLAYMVSGAASLPQAEVMDWLGTRRYQMGSIIEALRQNSEASLDQAELPSLSGAEVAVPLSGRPAILIGGGRSAERHASAILRFAKREEAVLIHSSMRNALAFEKASVPQVFCLAGQEYTRLSAAQMVALRQAGTLAVCPPPPRFQGTVPSDVEVYQVGRSEEIMPSRLGPVTDEPPLDLALDVARELGAADLYLAGFDGYADATLSQQKNARDVQEAIDRAGLEGTPWNGRVVSITPTLYAVPMISVYAEIQTDGA